MDSDNSVSMYKSNLANLSQTGTDSHNKVLAAYQQLATLNKVLTENKQVQKELDIPRPLYENELPYRGTPSVDTGALQRLENLGKVSSEADEPDSEMLQLNAMLDKVLDIQHPERWQYKSRNIKNTNDAETLLRVKNFSDAASIGTIAPTSPLKDSLAKSYSDSPVGFYGLSNPSLMDTGISNMQAIIYRDQEVVSGSTVQLMLTCAISINRIHIPKNSFLFGRASLQGERLEVNIPSIRYKDKILPVRLSVYDLDGLKGIYIPGAINRDASKQGADRAIQSIGLSSLNPSVSAQAAAAGIETAKKFLSKKVKLVHVTLKAGYQVLLFDENTK